ncbi:LLM class flavin-dependent oxidoreductase [Streptomyces yaizuensis]|uniref:LLM class flavin-dependent oxidoreductase n=1 Tax=Streptomyces yaizuensis TaxID=2989713 RepID=A0ABQ5NS21_9ACTN|nr:LLM class flavin-dependent oxidoreductase [Streptomyces sp. YSPA8]GLF92841.1 LLM class flavin-dependent oxidoreductase [Streptomyces sp. YSPA8]
MRIGLNFLPTLAPEELPAAEFYADCLDLCTTADRLGFAHVKAVEHYFHPWGGYSPDPVAFLSAVAARTHRVRLVTGACVPAFTHPVKLAASLAVLDNLSGGRLDAGFGRAFLPTEFAAFGVPMDESKDRMREGVDAVVRLWSGGGFRWEGTFHRFGPLPVLLPRPAQRPHPPVYVAATVSEDSFVWAGERGHNLMIIPIVASHGRLAGLLERYREARAAHGHPGPGRVHVSYHAYVAPDRAEALAEAERHFADYTAKQLEAYASWRDVRSDQYPGYEHMEAAVRGTRFQDLLDAGNVIAGSPADAADALQEIAARYPGAETSLHVRYGDISQDAAMRTVTLLGRDVLPKVADA